MRAMTIKYLMLILISPIALFHLSACSEETTTTKPPPSPNTLLTLNIDENYLNPDSAEGVVFVSSPEGVILDMATWQGSASIVLKNVDVHPDTISFTIVQNYNRNLDFETELGVPAGSVRNLQRIIKGETTGSAEVVFLNAPYCDRYRISHTWLSASGSGPLPASQTLQLFGDVTDCYVRIDPAGSPPLGGWVEGLQPEDTATLDFDVPGAVVPMSGTAVQIPSDGDRLICYLSTMVGSGSSVYSILLDMIALEENIPEEVTLFAPELDPPEYITWFILQSGNIPPLTYSMQGSIGPIPTVFNKMEGELTVLSTSPDSLVFATTSDWNRSVVNWGQEGELFARWSFKGPATVQAFALPKIPQYLTDLFPDYPREGFTFRTLEIYDDLSMDGFFSQGISFVGNEPRENLSPQNFPSGAIIAR